MSKRLGAEPHPLRYPFSMGSSTQIGSILAFQIFTIPFTTPKPPVLKKKSIW